MSPDGLWAPIRPELFCICVDASLRRLIRMAWPYGEGDRFTCYCGVLWLFTALPEQRLQEMTG